MSDKRNQYGKQIKYERCMAQMTMAELCEGLCSHSHLSRIEQGTEGCGKMLADALLQRAGVCADKFIYVITPDDQDWIVLREKLAAAIEYADYVLAQRLLNEYHELTESNRSKKRWASSEIRLHEQNIIIFQTLIDWKLRRDNQAVLKGFCDAWSMTMIGKPIPGRRRSYTLNELICAMMYCRVLEADGDVRSAAEGYRELLQHFEQYTDERDRVKLYPRVSYRLEKLLIQDKQHTMAAELAKKTVKLLIEQDSMVCLNYHLEIIKDYGALLEHEKGVLQDICDSLRWLYDYYKENDDLWLWYVSFSTSEFDLFGDYVRKRREALGITHEDIENAGIYDLRSIDAVEKNKATPKLKKRRQLMEMLKLSGSGFETVIQVERPELLKKAVKIDILLHAAKWEEALPLTEELKAATKRPDVYAKQYLQNTEAFALYNTGNLTAQEYIKRQEENLRLTMPILNKEGLEKWYFSHTEASIINNMSLAYEKVGQRDKAVWLLRLIQKQYESMPFDIMHYVSVYEITMRNLGSLLGNAGRLYDAIKASNTAIRVSLRASHGAALGTELYDMARNMEQLWDTDEYKKQDSLPFVKTAYALELLFGRKETCNLIRSHLNKYR